MSGLYKIGSVIHAVGGCSRRLSRYKHDERMTRDRPREHARTECDRRPRPDRLARRSDPAGRDASAGWREEYEHAHTAIPDGGVREPPGTPKPGDRVRDRDDPDDELVVVEVHNVRADAFVLDDLDGGPTVADLNEDYSPGSPVVDAVYTDDLGVGEGRPALDSLQNIVESGRIRSYSFPADRLDGGGETA